MPFMRSISIANRLWLILGISICTYVSFGALSLKQNHDDLVFAKEIKIQHLVEGSLGILEYFYSLEQLGEMTKEEAQERALETINAIRYGRNDYFWVNDLQPVMLMHPMNPSLDGKNLANYSDPDGKHIFIEFARIAREQGAGFYNYRWPMPGAAQPVDKISYVQLFEPWNWVIGTGVYIDDIQAEFKEIAIKTSSILFGVAVFMAILIIGIIRSITIPLGNVVTAMRNIASGEGDLTQNLSCTSTDEISELSTNFNAFTSKLRAMVRQLLDSANTLQVSATQLEQAASETLCISQRQTQETEQLATSMNEVTYAVQEVAQNAEQAANEVNEASKQAETGHQSIQNNLQHNDLLSSTINHAVSVINSLATETTQIESVLEVINTIAEQTNLLALNAAIEAARAGEQGRGFAVVADEVRLLAQRTQKSTEEVQQMIESLQKNSKDAVSVIEQSNKAAELAVEQASAASNNLAQISSALTTLNDLNASIASSTLQQSHVAEEINQNISRFAGLSQENTAAATQSSQASEHLKQLAIDLNKLLSQFKV